MRRKKRTQKRIPSQLVGLSARTADGTPYGQIVDVLDLGGGEIVEIVKLNGKIEMFPNSAQFLRLSEDKTYAILEPFEFVEAKPE